jgi:hypothetical protein
MLRRVALVKTDVSETANVVTSSPILITLLMEVLSSIETSVLTRAIRRNIPEDAILHSHCRENLKSYIGSICCFQSRVLPLKNPPRFDDKSGSVSSATEYFEFSLTT